MKKFPVILAMTIGSLATPVAAYDPAPDSNLAPAQGRWHGDLTYNDYSNPGSLVSIPTRMFAAMSSPTTLVLQLTFDDGPGKTVYSYESLDFDFSADRVTWTSGVTEPEVLEAKIVANTFEDSVRTLILERPTKEKLIRYTLELSAQHFSLATDEVSDSGSTTFRNRYQLTRP